MMPETRRPCIHVIAETDDPARPDACAALRLVDPFSHPSIKNRFDVSIVSGPLSSPVEIVVVQRMGSKVAGSYAALEDFVWSLKLSNTKLVYDIDDNLLD